MKVWGRERADEVMALVAAALPGENLTDDDVVANLFDDPDPVRVVADDAGRGVASAVVRGGTAAGAAGRPVVHLQLLAVDPSAHRLGVGTALVAELERWAFDDVGAGAVVIGAGAPFYLFAGADVHATAALCLFESMGYVARGAELNLSFPSRFRAPAPAGVELVRVLEEDDAAAVEAFCGAQWPNWIPELRRGIEHGACHFARRQDDGDVVGFGCHSVNRLGWLGPIGTDPSGRRSGVGTALLSAISKDVMAAGFDTVEVSWIGPIGFYAKAAGASVSRVFRSLALPWSAWCDRRA
ncbi:MAG TPA: GNAT family N-acetyltransferase [Acidimicrobiales bacterium]|nr:GNAT family N-acetyltransferase [Acidimicrobiales bacterium]